MAYAFDLAKFCFHFVYDAFGILGKLELDQKCNSPKRHGFLAIAHNFRGCGCAGFDFGFDGVKVFDDVFGKNLIGYYNMAHEVSPFMVL